MTTTLAAPVTSITLAALTPDVVRSCIVLQPSPPPEPGEEPPGAIGDNDIYTPVAPGVTYAGLPTVSIVDTSPDQLIGCIIDTADNPQGRLNALFPAAIDGDGVIERSTNDIWVYDGSEWNNVGPTPGPTIVTATIIPPWNEILTYEARIRTRLLAQSLAYALQLLTEPDPITTRTTLEVLAQRIVRIPDTDIQLSPEAPALANPYTLVRSIVPVLYQGNGTSQTISGLPWSPGIVWIKARDLTRHHILFDSVRGAPRYIQLSQAALEISDSSTLSAFTGDGFTVGNNFLVNASTSRYVAWAFPPVAAPVTDTSGTITSTVHRSTFYNIIEYTGNGTAGATIGHGLPVRPTFLFTSCLTLSTDVQAGGSLVGDNQSLRLNSPAAAFTSTVHHRVQDATTFTVGGATTVNSSTQPYVTYAFHDVQNLCKSGSYVGDGDAAGTTVNLGFKPDFILIKGLNVSGGWNVIDVARDLGNNELRIANSVETTTTSDFYELTSTGFIGKLGTPSNNHNLNIATVTYIYLAFRSFRPTVIAPFTELTVTAELPVITVN